MLVSSSIDLAMLQMLFSDSWQLPSCHTDRVVNRAALLPKLMQHFERDSRQFEH